MFLFCVLVMQSFVWCACECGPKVSSHPLNGLFSGDWWGGPPAFPERCPQTRDQSKHSPISEGQHRAPHKPYRKYVDLYRFVCIYIDLD